jgi:hypothetical protein
MPLIVFFFLISSLMSVWSRSIESSQDEYGSQFSGQISRINSVAKLIRVITDFANIKFFNHKDRVEFWNESYPEKRCPTFVEGRTNDYLLLRISQYDECIRRVHFTTGSYLKFQSPDLAKTVGIVTDLLHILLKKRLAMQVKKERHHRELTGHVEKVDAVNKRFEILRQKLEIEWQKELAALEEDKAKSFTEFKNAEARLNEIDVKLEAYRLEDHNLKLDRWSLDPALYQKK